LNNVSLYYHDFRKYELIFMLIVWLWRISGGYSYKDNKTNQEVLLPCSLEYYVM